MWKWQMASGPVIRLRLAIIRLTLAPKQHDDALVIEHSAMCVCATYIVYHLHVHAAKNRIGLIMCVIRRPCQLADLAIISLGKNSSNGRNNTNSYTCKRTISGLLFTFLIGEHLWIGSEVLHPVVCVYEMHCFSVFLALTATKKMPLTHPQNMVKHCCQK